MRKRRCVALTADTSSRPELKLAFCDFNAAKFACAKWHYSGKPPNAELIRVGVWEARQFVGVVLYGRGANAGLLNPYGLTQWEGCELVRIALKHDHASPVSQIVAKANKMLKQSNPGMRLIVSFADPEQGHHGGIYQAGNWIYAGMSIPADEYVVNGRRYQGRALRSTRSTHKLKSLPATNILDWARKVLDPNAYAVAGSRKHRYLYPLDRAMRKQIAPLAKPYPKREVTSSAGPTTGTTTGTAM